MLNKKSILITGGTGSFGRAFVKEILKSGKDPVYFINNYCRISHPMKGLISFKTYPYQDDLLREFNDYRFNIILKARQLGISTITAAYCVWMMLFHRDKAILVMATKFATALNNFTSAAIISGVVPGTPPVPFTGPPS